jgi:hypothetical protein
VSYLKEFALKEDIGRYKFIMPSSTILRHVAAVRTDVSEEASPPSSE